MKVVYYHRIRCRGGRRLDMSNEVGAIFFTVFGQMHLVAGPSRAALGGVAGARILNRVDAHSGRRRMRLLSPDHLPLLLVKVLEPDTSQGLHDRNLAYPFGYGSGIHRSEQEKRVGSYCKRPFLLSCMGGGRTMFLHVGLRYDLVR
jgi:hypothetical protein